MFPYDDDLQAKAEADAEDPEAVEAEEALAAAELGVTHTQGADPEDPGHTYVHHEAMLDYQPDKTVPQHLPTFITAAQASFPMGKLHTNIAPAHMPEHIKSI